MKISTKKINELREKLDISFEESIELLRKNDGDIDKSIKRYYRQKKDKKTEVKNDFSSFLSDICRYRFSVCRKNRALINLPLLVIIGLFILAYQPLWRIVIIVAAIIIISGSEVKIFKEELTKEDFRENNPCTSEIKENSNEDNNEEISGGTKSE